MRTWTKVWQDQELTPWQESRKVNTAKLLRYLKHFEELNSSLKNDLTRDDIQRAKDEGRWDAYQNVIFAILQTDLLAPDSESEREA